MKHILLSIFMIASGICAGAQSPPSVPPAPYAGLPVQEKIFAHTDKDFYLAGEILWLKLYVVDAAFHRPMDLSKLAYVEILSREQRPVLQAKIALANGAGSGSFQLPFSIPSGNYIFRAYTNWMKNMGPDTYYEKVVTIFNTLRNNEARDSLPPVPAAGPENDIQFFPEGGNLVKGLPNRVAFRIADRSGKGLPSKGALVNTAGDTLARFQTLLFGMGQFSFTPAESTGYKAVFDIKDHSGITQDLPPAEDKGFTMELDDAGQGRLSVTVRTPTPVRAEEAMIGLVVHTRHSITRIDEKNISSGEARFTVETNGLEDGVSQFTILNSRKIPVSERLWFHYPARLTLTPHTDKETYSPREKVTLDISARDSSGRPIQLNGSMAVVLQDSLQSTGSEDIQNYLLLSSDLRGTIESPGYYFSDNSREVTAGMDLLMRVQGWRRFRQPAATFKYPPEYAGLLVTGRITHRLTGAPAAGIPTWLSAPGQRFQLGYGISNKDGDLQWNLGMLYGAHELVVQTGNPLIDSLYRIDLLSPFADPLVSGELPPFQLPTATRDLLLRHSIGAQAQNAYQPDKRQHFLQPLLTDTANFYGQPDKRYLLDDYTRFTTMEEVMREYVREAKVHDSKGKFTLNLQSDQANQLFFDDPPLLMVDGVPISDFTGIIHFDPLKFRKIEIVTKRHLLNDSLFNGIINYRTYQGDLSGFPVDRNATIEEYEGLQLQREFYSPVYETKNEQDSRIPDLRNTLYWSPGIFTNQDGRQQCSFYTSDLPGRYTALIQGITAEGKSVSTRTSFFVAFPGKGIAH